MRNDILEEMNAETFNIWRHHPITSAYLKFLADQASAMRETAADLLEQGLLDPNSPNAALNANMIRGRLLTLRELVELRLENIQEFYSQANQESDETDDRRDEYPPDQER